MRNRGVEICILGTWEDNEDIRSLINHSGVTDTPVSNCLYEFHEKIQQSLPSYEAPDINVLKRASSIAGRLMQLGCSPGFAIQRAVSYSYIR